MQARLQNKFFHLLWLAKIMLSVLLTVHLKCSNKAQDKKWIKEWQKASFEYDMLNAIDGVERGRMMLYPLPNLEDD